jgi:hypothetical protein
MTRCSLVLLLGSVGCAAITGTAPIAVPSEATAVRVVVHITVGQPLVERDVRLALAEHGRWIRSSLGDLWIPAVAEREEFVPYVTHGQWVQTAQGPQWSSPFVWGPIVYHYGRWVRLGSRWAWRFGPVYAPSTVRWRRSGSYVGWSVSGYDEWCWLLLDELYAPSPSRLIERGRAAEPIAATSREIARPELELGIGWGPQGRPHGADGTTRGPERLGSASSDPRWSTVVIRDERAEQAFEQLVQYEHSLPALHSAVPVSPSSSTVTRARMAPSVTPATPSAPATLWSDQERLRAPDVANIEPRWTPHAMLRAPVATVQRTETVQQPAAERVEGPSAWPSPAPLSAVVGQRVVAMVGRVSTAVPTVVTHTPVAVARPAPFAATTATTVASTTVRVPTR